MPLVIIFVIPTAVLGLCGRLCDNGNLLQFFLPQHLHRLPSSACGTIAPYLIEAIMYPMDYVPSFIPHFQAFSAAEQKNLVSVG